MRTVTLLALTALTACAPQRPLPGNVPQSANPSAVIAAELAFNRLAQEKGQWTAFREYAGKSATMFVPEVVDAQTWLRGKADPAKSVKWQPHKVFMSCDGRTGVTTGASQWPDGSHGYFTSVWQWMPKGKPDPRFPNIMGEGEWKWIMDHGDGVTSPRAAPEFIETKVASCKGRANAPLMAPDEGVQMKSGFSYDQSLNWEWQVGPDKSRTISVRLWNGVDFDEVLVDKVAAGR